MGDLCLQDGRLQGGDRLLKINDTPVTGMVPADVASVLRGVGDTAHLTITRPKSILEHNLDNQSGQNGGFALSTSLMEKPAIVEETAAVEEAAVVEQQTLNQSEPLAILGYMVSQFLWWSLSVNRQINQYESVHCVLSVSILCKGLFKS